MEPLELTILLKCNLCERSGTAAVPEHDWNRYVEGVLPSKAFTTLTKAQNSLISSGVCERCWLAEMAKE